MGRFGDFHNKISAPRPDYSRFSFGAAAPQRGHGLEKIDTPPPINFAERMPAT
jgi:hypothetical protein